MRRAFHHSIVCLLFLSWFVAACAPASVASLPVPGRTASLTPTSSLIVGATPAPATATPLQSTDSRAGLWLDPALPATFRKQVEPTAGWQFVSHTTASAAQLRILPQSEAAQAQRYWVYALATPFFQRLVEASASDLQARWRQDNPVQPIWMSPETAAVFTALWGLPGENALQLTDSAALLDQAWAAQADWALLPFDQLEPRWRVLRVDDQSPFDPNFQVASYSLSVPIGWEGQVAVPPAVLPASNYQRDQLTVLAMTGVTALVRRTAALMNAKGVLYPASAIGTWLRQADLTHISNEVSFNSNCSPQKAALREALFCSPPDYLRLLEQVGTDVIELTGNHNLDRGADAYRETLELYAQRGWATYGGGRDLAAAQEPLLIESHGNRLAFLGCNMAGPDIAWATADSPGAAPCDFPALEAQVHDLRQAGYLPVVTLQAFETEDYSPAPMQQPTEFLRLAETGAVVVSGSQAHVPQGFAFAGDGLVHFGLGNLFFDQTDSLITRRAFIDRHVFYQGRYLGVELFPVDLEEYGRPVPLLGSDRDEFLDTILSASEW